MPTGVYNRSTSQKALTSVLRGAGTVQGDTIDRGSDNVSVLVVIITSAITDGTQTFTLQDSDDGSSWSAASASNVLPATAVATAGAGDSNKVYEIAYVGPKRYVRLQIVTTGATGGIAGAIAVKEGGRKPTMR